MPRRDPKCTHRGNPVGRVAWPTGMPQDGEPHASTYVCERPACQDDAAEWVREITGTRGVFVPFEQRQPALFPTTAAELGGVTRG
jgi:hypothetical protein